MDKSGTPLGRIWSPKYGSVSTIRKGQLAFTFSKEAVSWIIDIVAQKIDNQQALLLMMKVEDSATNNQIQKAVTRLEDYRNKVRHLKGDIVTDIAPSLRGWEGVSSQIYFKALNLFIPDKYKFDKRSQHPAMDVVNAFLNYGYGLLYARIEGLLIRAGIDPYVGVFHRDDYNRPVLVYDVIELYRIWVDYVVMSLVTQEVITDEYYSIRDDGSYWLEGLGRRVLIQSFNDYFEEVITVSGVSRSRENQILLFTQSLAQTFKKFN